MKLGIRRIAVAAAASLFLFSAVTASAAEPFSIALPTGFGAFTTQSQTVDAPDGKIETSNWISKSPTGEAVVVTVSKMPAKILSPEKLMASSRDSLLKSLNATLESETKVEGRLAGTQLNFKSTGAWLSSRVLVDDSSLYQLLYVGRSEEMRANPSVSQMFESFQVTAPAVAAAVPAAETATSVE
jgi:hypothetical protein